MELSRLDAWMRRCKDARMHGCVGCVELYRLDTLEEVDRAWVNKKQEKTLLFGCC